MKTNMGFVDRAIRTVIAIIIVALYLTGAIGGLTASVLLIAATAFVLTSLIGVCPMYFPLKISTRRNKATDA